MDEEEVIPQSIQSQKIVLATQYSDAVISLVQQAVAHIPFTTDTEWGTIKNAITIDAQSTLIQNLVSLLERIKQGDQSVL